MIVTRVLDETGSHIVPELDDAWPDLQKLRWCAAVAELDGGLPAGTFSIWEASNRRFSLQWRTPTGVQSMPHAGFKLTWTTIVCMGAGAALSRAWAESGA